MTDQIVNEWIGEWNMVKDSDKEKIEEFSESLLHNEDLFQAISHVLEESERFKLLYNEVISTLFKFYRTSSQKKLQLFCTQFIPSLIYEYLHQIHSQKKCVALETLLRGIFELENGSDDKIPTSARIPNIHLPSIYHDPGGVSTTWLSDGELDRLTAKTVKVINRPNLIFTEERVRAPQRLPLCTELWWIFNHRLPDMPKHPVPSYLKTISKLITQGFVTGGAQRTHPQQRIVLSPKLFIEMIQTIYFSVYNGAPTLAEQVLEEAHSRANYHCWADAMLVCNAVRNYLKSSVVYRPLRRTMKLNLRKHPMDQAYGKSRNALHKMPIYLVFDTIGRTESMPPNQVFDETNPIELPWLSIFDRITETCNIENIPPISEESQDIVTITPENVPPIQIVDKTPSKIPVQLEPSTFKKSIITNASFRTKKLPEDIPIVESEIAAEELADTPSLLAKSKSKLPHILSKMKRNSVVVINEEGDTETLATPPERKKSIDATAV